MTPGWRWYTDARALVYGLAEVYQRDPRTVAGIIAALSQRQQWRRNVRAAEAVLAGRPAWGLRSATKKALSIAAGADPEEVLRGPKIRAFYRAILGDDEAVVIDSWMCRAYQHHEKPTPVQYERLAERCRGQARIRGIPPAVWQAITWCKVRGGAA